MAAKILIIDDEPDLADVLMFDLETRGHIVTAVNTAKDALTKFSAQAFDLVITDVNMPGMSGIDLCRSIHDVKPEVPIVVMSGVASVDQDLSPLGVKTVLRKPFSLQDLADLIQKIVAT